MISLCVITTIHIQIRGEIMQKLAPLFILFAAILWGTTGTVQALAPDSAQPVAIGAVRLFIGGGFLLVLVLLTKGLRFREIPFRPVLIAAVCMALFQPFFFNAVDITGVAIGTVVSIGSAPVLSGLIEFIFLKKKISKTWLISTVFSLIGVSLLFTSQGSVQVEPIGILLALCAGLSFACYTISNKYVVEKLPALTAVAVVFTLSGLMLSPLLLIFDISWVFTTDGLIVGLYMGIIATGLSYFMFAKGLAKVDSSTAVTLSLAEPLTATMLGVFLLGETMSFLSWTGLILLLLGIGVLIFSSAQRSKLKKLPQ